MRNKILLLALVFLFPSLTFAAYNDVTLTKDVTQLSINGTTVNIHSTNGTMETLTVNPTNFVVLLQQGSGFTASTTDHSTLNTDAVAPFLVTNVCNGTESYLTVTNGVSGSATVTVTPTGTACSTAETVTTTGGSVGVSYIAPTTSSSQNTPAKTTTTQTITTPTVTTTSSMMGITFTKRLTNGSTGTDVTNLQRYLASDPTVYPEGKITGTFGSLTQKAVQKFQEKYGIAKKGVAGYGEIGPATRAKLNVLMSTATVTTAPSTQATVSTSSNLESQIASLLKMVAELTAQLNTKKTQ
ncbi:hypothetical protein D4R99_00955 [bacterium]|nr:MAG: hypothetical protein D4R99_00955 [bacterium]